MLEIIACIWIISVNGQGNGDIRLNNTDGVNPGDDPYYGYVEVYYEGRWDTVCDDGIVEAGPVYDVICRQLGYTNVVETYTASNQPWGHGSGNTALLDDVVCTGSELKLADCSHRGLGVSGCGNTEDISVKCGGYGYCSNGGTFNWDTLVQDGLGIPYVNVTKFDINETDYSLNIAVELEYMNKATANGDNEAFYGVTYVLDFGDFNAYSDAIYEPGTCQNRDGSSFNDSSLTWDDYWSHPLYPYYSVGTSPYLAYPPPGDHWTIDESNICDHGTIVYEASFGWNELIECESYDLSEKYVQTTDDVINQEIRLEGIFYINLVSPLSYISDGGYYRVYQLLAQPFVISIDKQISILDYNGIDWGALRMNVIAVYKQDTVNTFALIVLTESQEYMQLTRTDTALYMFEPDNGGLITAGDFTAPLVAKTANEGCLNSKALICTQLWEISAENVECTNDVPIDFSGNYTLQFTPECRDSAEIGADLNQYCQDYLAQYPDIANGIDLRATLTWKDEVCDPLLFATSFEATTTFYVDGAYSVPAESDQLYQAGTDRIYVQIDASFPSAIYDILETSLVNVWICTFDPLIVPSPITPNNTAGGCFSTDKDDGNDGHIYSVNPLIEEEGFELIPHPTDTDILRFSFIAPSYIQRDRLYVHALVEVTLVGGTRRRLLGQQQEANQMQHFVEDFGINPDSEGNTETAPSAKTESNISPWMIATIAIGSIVFISLLVLMVIMYHRKRQDQQQKEQTMAEMKSADSTNNGDGDGDAESQETVQSEQ